jgi:adenylate cyclase
LLLDIYPQTGVALELKGWCVGVKGDWKKAAEIFEEVHRLQVNHSLRGLFPLGCAYANMGEVGKAVECIRKIEKWQEEEPEMVLDADLAMIWSSLGDKDKTFYYLLQCVEKKMGPVAIIMNHPMFNIPHDDPRYQLLKEKLNLTE